MSNSVGSVFIKKNNQTEIIKKKNRNQFELAGFGSIRFGFFSGKTGLVRFFRFGSVFLVLAQFFNLAWFFFGLVWFYKSKTDTKPVGFFKILIGLIWFFSRFGFFDYFFLIFLLTPR